MSIAQTAATLLARYGEPVTITFPVVGDYDAITGEPAPAPDQILSATGVGYTGQYNLHDELGPISAGDIRLVLSLATRPMNGCLAAVDGATYRVVDVTTVRKSGADVVYICQLRRN
jgi:hypothetical protein